MFERGFEHCVTTLCNCGLYVCIDDCCGCGTQTKTSVQVWVAPITHSSNFFKFGGQSLWASTGGLCVKRNFRETYSREVRSDAFNFIFTLKAQDKKHPRGCTACLVVQACIVIELGAPLRIKCRKKSSIMWLGILNEQQGLTNMRKISQSWLHDPRKLRIISKSYWCFVVHCTLRFSRRGIKECTFEWCPACFSLECTPGSSTQECTWDAIPLVEDGRKRCLWECAGSSMKMLAVIWEYVKSQHGNHTATGNTIWERLAAWSSWGTWSCMWVRWQYNLSSW